MFSLLPLLALTSADTRQITGGSSSNQNALAQCYEAWGEHPFQDPAEQEFTYIEPIIRVMGFGSAEYSDEPTTEPTLYLVGLNINDLTRTTYAFNNPNGWYCFYTSVVITAKQEVHIVEGAHLADSQSKVHVLGKGDERHSGIIVLGGIGVYDK